MNAHTIAYYHNEIQLTVQAAQRIGHDKSNTLDIIIGLMALMNNLTN
jgi:hypothetical protein